MYIFLDFTLSNYDFPLHFPSLSYRIYISYLSSQNFFCIQQGSDTSVQSAQTEC